MGNQLSNALARLGEGLSTIAMYRAGKEEKQEERAYQQQMMEGQRAFQERLLDLQQAQGEKMFSMEREFRTAEREDKQKFDIDMFEKTSAIQKDQFAQEMAARWAGIRAQAAAAARSGSGANERQLTRQLGVYEKQIELAAGEYSGVREAMNEELKELGKDKMLSMRPKQMQAAKDAVMSRYTPQLQEIKSKIDKGMETYASAVGIEPKADFSAVSARSSSTAHDGGQAQPGMSGGMAATGTAMNEERITQAVEAAMPQLRLGTLPPERDLVAGFIKAGLSKAEAVKAARMAQRQAPRESFKAQGGR